MLKPHSLELEFPSQVRSADHDWKYTCAECSFSIITIVVTSIDISLYFFILHPES